MNVTDVPAQIGPLGPATVLMVGTTLPLTTTGVVPAKLVQPDTVTVMLYVPAMPALAVKREGFCVEETKAPGPVQLYVAVETAGVVNKIVDPKQTGEFPLAVGVAGIGFTITVVVPAKLAQPFVLVIVTLYVPPISVVAPVLVGFCKADVKVLGPVQE